MDISPDSTSTETEPITKERSVLDFTYLSLEELEEEVKRIFPNTECAECSFHLELLSAIPFSMMCHGWTKEELLEVFSIQLNDAQNYLTELEKEKESA